MVSPLSLGFRLPSRLTKHLPDIHQRSHPSVHQDGSPLGHQQAMAWRPGWLPDNER